SRLEDAHTFEVLVRPGDRVRIDEELLGEVADAGHQVARGRVPAGDAEDYLGGNLLVDRHRRIGPDVDAHDRSVDRVYQLTSTLRTHGARRQLISSPRRVRSRSGANDQFPMSKQ